MRKWLSVLIALAMYSLACPRVLLAAESPYAVSEQGFFALLDLRRPELSAVREAVEKAEWAGAKQAWASHLEKRERPCWLWSRHDKAGIMAAYEKQFGGMSQFTARADKVLAHDFEFEGVRKQLERQIEWDHGRIEWTHVLSRFAYWNDLGRAYWATGNRAYATEFVDELKQWVGSNPVPELQQAKYFGSRWRVLEAGIRGQGWFDAMEYFMDAPEFDVEAKFLMSRCLAEHALYLSAWERKAGYLKGNWQVAECTGLASIGVMLPEFKDAADWRSLGLGLLVQHMEKDVLPDGAHWELTPGYHTWVMMELLRAAQLCKLNGVEARGLLARHERMFEFLMALAKPDRCVPRIGDAGVGGRTIEASLGLGALLYHRSDMRWLGCKEPQSDWLWMLGLDAVQKYSTLLSAEPSMRSVLLPDSRYVVMRTGWRTNDCYLLFDCAPWHGGHSHCDQLQVLAYAGRDLIVEPGMCSYDQPQSVMLRKSAAHNVVLVDGRELPKTDPKLVGWQTTPEADFAAALMENTNYQRQRSVLFVKPSYWVVVDHILGEGEHEITRLFHLSRGSDAKADGNIARTAFAEGANIQIVTTDGATLEMRKAIIPTAPATFETAPVAAFVTRQKLPAVLCTVLIPFTDPNALPVVSKVVATHPLVRKLSLKYPSGQSDELAFANEVRPLHLSGKEGHGRAFIVRCGPTNSVFELGNWAAKP